MLDWQWAKEHVKGWPFEQEIPRGVRLNLGCGRIILPKEDGWVNVDKTELDGVNKVCNLFEFPWPFEGNWADFILASHLIEHIPHVVPLCEQGESEKTTIWRVHKLDGLFAFFAECWRVLKPGGLMICIAPYGMSTMAMQDPTHTRFIVPATFSYLANAEDSPFDYQVPFKFEAPRGAIVYAEDFMTSVPQEHQAFISQHNVNSLHSIRCDLVAVK